MLMTFDLQIKKTKHEFTQGIHEWYSYVFLWNIYSKQNLNFTTQTTEKASTYSGASYLEQCKNLKGSWVPTKESLHNTSI